MVALIGQELIDSIDNWIENHIYATRQGGRNDVPNREMMVDSRKPKFISADIIGYIQVHRPFPTRETR
jgi:hypothetical protein